MKEYKVVAYDYASMDYTHIEAIFYSKKDAEAYIEEQETLPLQHDFYTIIETDNNIEELISNALRDL